MGMAATEKKHTARLLTALRDLRVYRLDAHTLQSLLENLVHPEDRQMLKQGLQGKGRFHERATLRYRHRDGRLIWIERMNVPIYDKAGKLVAIEGIARDVTENKSFEQALL